MRIKVIFAALTLAGTMSLYAQSAGDDIKEAGKKTTSATKKAGKKTTSATKKGVSKAAEGTEKGAKAVKNKTTGGSE